MQEESSILGIAIMKLAPGIVYEENLLWMPYQAKHTEGHAWLKILAMDHDTGAAAALIKYEAGYKAPKTTSRVYSDALYIQGELVNGDKTCTNLTYQYLPPNSAIGPIEAKQETIKFIITGGKGERCSKKPVFMQNVDGPVGWKNNPYYVHQKDVLSKTLREDKEANCTIGWRVFPKVALTYPNQTQYHAFAEEVFCVDGENVDFDGDVEGFIKWRRGMYICRPPNMSRHGHSLKTRTPFKVIVKHHSLKPSEGSDRKEGLPSTFVE